MSELSSEDREKLIAKISNLTAILAAGTSDAESQVLTEQIRNLACMLWLDGNPETEQLPVFQTVDRAQKLLNILGWSFGHKSHWTEGREVCQVYCRRGIERILVNANGQNEAWNEALRQAGNVQRG